jgi:hypothetical protein
MGVDHIGIEAAFDPIGKFRATFVIGVDDCSEKVGKAERATDVFGRGASGDLNQARIGDARYGVNETLDLDGSRRGTSAFSFRRPR